MFNFIDNYICLINLLFLKTDEELPIAIPCIVEQALCALSEYVCSTFSVDISELVNRLHPSASMYDEPLDSEQFIELVYFEPERRLTIQAKILRKIINDAVLGPANESTLVKLLSGLPRGADYILSRELALECDMMDVLVNPNHEDIKDERLDEVHGAGARGAGDINR